MEVKSIPKNIIFYYTGNSVCDNFNLNISNFKKYPKARIEIFSISNELGYTPTYNFYKNGELIKNYK